VWDGKTLTNVSQTPEDDYSPTWSKDGQLAFITGNNKVYICGETCLHFIDINKPVSNHDLYLQWVSHDRLFFRSNAGAYLLDEDMLSTLLTNNIIEYGDGAIAFVSNGYRDDGLSELYVLDGQNSVGTGLVGPKIYMKHDGKSGLLVGVYNINGANYDLYHWKDGQARRLTNTPDISEYGPSFRP
jgi:WD40-like Beta Propeller Repeat